MNISVGKLGKMFNLSRSTLLYYDSIGLLKPSARSGKDYRLYSESDIEKLRRIIMYRDVGLPLDEIPSLLTNDGMNITTILIKRLSDLNREVESIRRQQDIIIRLLKTSGVSMTKDMKKHDWVRLVKAAGIDEDMMDEWHRMFERHSPEQHESFLRLLEFSESEIREIRSCYSPTTTFSS